MLRAIILACAIFVGAQGRLALFGCPEVTPKPSVFYPTMIGTWFEYGGYFDMERVGTECTTYTISLFIDVILTIETSVKDRGTGEITTNSTSYAIDQVSQNGELEASDFLWILARSRDGLDEASLDAIRNTLSDNGLNFPFFRTNQAKCDCGDD